MLAIVRNSLFWLVIHPGTEMLVCSKWFVSAKNGSAHTRSLKFCQGNTVILYLELEKVNVWIVSTLLVELKEASGLSEKPFTSVVTYSSLHFFATVWISRYTMYDNGPNVNHNFLGAFAIQSANFLIFTPPSLWVLFTWTLSFFGISRLVMLDGMWIHTS